MPKTDVHITASVRKTGKGHHAVQGFEDFEGKKPEPHDITRMVDFGIGSGKNIRLYRVAREDVELLRKAGVSEDDSTLKQYLDYHREIQAMMGNP
jgi:hypothetical protein